MANKCQGFWHKTKQTETHYVHLSAFFWQNAGPIAANHQTEEHIKSVDVPSILKAEILLAALKFGVYDVWHDSYLSWSL